MNNTETEQVRSLLEQNHEFPTSYRLRLILRNLPTATTGVLVELEAAGISLSAPMTTPRLSQKGTYLPLGLTFNARDADHVVEVCQLLRGVDEVILCPQKTPVKIFRYETTSPDQLI